MKASRGAVVYDRGMRNTSYLLVRAGRKVTRDVVEQPIPLGDRRLVEFVDERDIGNELLLHTVHASTPASGEVSIHQTD